MKKCEMLYEGKAKKVYTTEDPELYIVDYKDDATAFNGLKKGTISGKGVINNLSTFIFGLIRAIGLILLGFGVVQIGLSLKSHDPSQRANGFLTLAGGVIITFAKEILDLIVG